MSTKLTYWRWLPGLSVSKNFVFADLQPLGLVGGYQVIIVWCFMLYVCNVFQVTSCCGFLLERKILPVVFALLIVYWWPNYAWQSFIPWLSWCKWWHWKVQLRSGQWNILWRSAIFCMHNYCWLFFGDMYCTFMWLFIRNLRFTHLLIINVCRYWNTINNSQIFTISCSSSTDTHVCFLNVLIMPELIQSAVKPCCQVEKKQVIPFTPIRPSSLPFPSHPTHVSSLPFYFSLLFPSHLPPEK